MLKHWFRNYGRRGDVERELSEEMRGYVEEMTARGVAEGLTEAAARRAVLAEIGGVTALTERVREERAGFELEALMWKPFQQAMRKLWQARGFTAVAVLTLALAIGANTAIFSIADHVLFRAMPYQDPDRVQVIQLMNRKQGKQYTMVPLDNLQQIDERAATLSRTATIQPARPILLTVNGETERVVVAEATPNYFELLGVRAYRGRLFQPQDDGVVLTYAGWMKRFAGDEGVIGRIVTLGNAQLRILGVLTPDYVMPSAFVSFLARGEPEVIRMVPPPRAGETGGTLHPIVRIEPGVSREQAQAELAAISGGDSYPYLNDVKEVLFPTGRRMMGFLLAAAVLVLLIGCSNLAIMLTVRGQGSARETGVRAALGASRWQLVAPVFFEALAIGAMGAALALVLTAVTFRTLLLQVPAAVYGSAPVGVDLRVGLFAMALGVLGGLIFAVLPAWRSAHTDVQGLIQGREAAVVRRGRLGVPLVTVQVALAVVLMVGAVRVGRAFWDATHEPLGFDPENLIAAEVVPSGPPDADGVAVYEALAQAMRRIPGVVSASAGYQVPVGTRAPWGGVRNGVGTTPVLPGYFETLGIPLVRGRLLNEEDVRGGREAAVLTERAAQLLFPGRDPIGETFEAPVRNQVRKHRVVGVVKETKHVARQEAEAYILPLQRVPMFLLVRTAARQDALLTAVRKETARLIPGVAVPAAWMRDTLDAQPRMSDPRFQTLVLGTFGGLALGLTALGVFGVVAFSVAVRTREMGIRMAVGAKPAGLVGMVVRESLTPVAAGVIVGLAASRWAGRVAEARVGLLGEADWRWTVAAAGVVALGALVAAWGPALRASRVDPVVVLRSE